MKGKTEPVQLWRALRVVAGAWRLDALGGARGPVRRPRPRAAARQGPVPRLRRGTARAARARLRDRRASASRGWRGSSRSTSTASLRTRSGTAAAASRTARASRTGRWPRWCACAAASLEDEDAAIAGEKLTLTLEEHLPDAEERAWVRPRLAHLLGLEDGLPRRRGEPLLGLADPLRAARREVPDGPALRGRAVGRRRPARLHRVPARLVAQPAALRVRARPARVRREAPDLGRQARLHAALPRAAAGRRRWTSCSPASYPACRTSCASACSSAPRACRSTPSRRSACCSTAACSTRDGDVYRPTGPIEQLEMPETLHALVAARLDGLDARGAQPRPGRRRARQDVHEAGPGRADGHSARSSSSRSSPRCCARRCSRSRPTRSRPSEASTRSCRTSSSASPTRRSPARPQGQAPRDRRLPAHPARKRRGRDRRGRRRSIYIDALEAAPDAPDAAEIRDRAREMLSAPASGPRRSPRRSRPSGLRAGRRSQRRRSRTGRAVRARRDRGPYRRARARTRGHASSAQSSSTKDPRRATRPPGSMARLAEVLWDLGTARGRSRPHESVVRAALAG